jgi:Cu2+-exporting ATPase
MLNSALNQDAVDQAETDYPFNMSCFHCNEIIPVGTELVVEINGELQPMCCHGCQAVAQTIVDYGLIDYYKFRSNLPAKPDEVLPEFLDRYLAYDDVRLQESFVEQVDDKYRVANLILEGIVCPACIWLIESRLNKLIGVNRIQINYTTNRARIRWDDSQIHLSLILSSITSLGFTAYPYDPGKRDELLEKDRKNQLRRIGLSAVLGIQVMMISIALYAGNWRGMNMDLQIFMQWVNLVLTTPVVFYSALPFFRGAFRDIQQFHPGMDVPVSLGILIAYLGSIEATISQQGHIYYDSVVMFVVWLLFTRYMEFSARKHASEECVPITDLVVGDNVLVRPGETIPADAVITRGVSSVNESIITGECMPVTKHAGDEVIGGSINIDSPINIGVTRIGSDSTVSWISHLLEEAQSEKPAMTQLANRIASWFVSFVLIIAAITTWYWWQVGTDSWLPITISILVVTPTAITASSVALMRRGIAIIHHNAVENLARATHFIFDKTGTLTFGKLQLVDVVCTSDLNEKECTTIAAAIEQYSEHPTALAITDISEKLESLVASEIINSPGEGISGIIEGERYFLGTPGYIIANTDIAEYHPDKIDVETEHISTTLLADEQSFLCAFIFSDQIRPSAKKLINLLNTTGKHTMILSGDQSGIVSSVAKQLGIKEAFSELRPDNKLSKLKGLQNNGAITAAIGDGINDAPLLAASHVSIAMGKGTDITKICADIILMNDELDMLQEGILITRKTYNIIKQNIVWAIAYNFLALPAAATGLLAPWMAAIGMSLSSLIVVGNATRIVKS